jgi:hypothetical protein
MRIRECPDRPWPEVTPEPPLAHWVQRMERNLRHKFDQNSNLRKCIASDSRTPPVQRMPIDDKVKSTLVSMDLA